MKNAAQIDTKNFPFGLLFKGKSNTQKAKSTKNNFADFFGINQLLIKKLKSNKTKLINKSLNREFASVKNNLKTEMTFGNTSELILGNNKDKKENVEKLSTENNSKTDKIKGVNSNVNKSQNNLTEKNTIGVASESSKNNIKIQSDSFKNNVVKSEIISTNKTTEANLSKVKDQSGKISPFVIKNSKENSEFTANKKINAEIISPKLKNTNENNVVLENSKNHNFKVKGLAKINAEFNTQSQVVKCIGNGVNYQINNSENILTSKENPKNNNEIISKEINQNVKLNSNALSNVSNKIKSESINYENYKNPNITKKIDAENTSKNKFGNGNDGIQQNQKSTSEILVNNQIKENRINPSFERSAEDSSLTKSKNDISKKFNNTGDAKEDQKNSQDTASNSQKVLSKEKVNENENLDKISGKLSVLKTKSTDSTNKHINNKVSEENIETPVKNDVKNIESKKIDNFQPTKDQLIVSNKMETNSFKVEKMDQLIFDQNPINNTSPIINSSANSIVNSFFSTMPSILSQMIQYSEIAKNIKLNVSKFNIDLGQNEKLEIQFTKQGENHSAKIIVGSETSLHSIEKLIPEIKIQLENRGINFIALDVEMKHGANENKRNQNSQQVNKNHKYNTINNESNNQIISQISNIRDFGYNTIELLA